VGKIPEEEKMSGNGRTYSICLEEYVKLISKEKVFS
jgi:hypothetical protein